MELTRGFSPLANRKDPGYEVAYQSGLLHSASVRRFWSDVQKTDNINTITQRSTPSNQPRRLHTLHCLVLGLLAHVKLLYFALGLLQKNVWKLL
jgi:hypothetical protein